MEIFQWERAPIQIFSKLKSDENGLFQNSLEGHGEREPNTIVFAWQTTPGSDVGEETKLIAGSIASVKIEKVIRSASGAGRRVASASSTSIVTLLACIVEGRYIILEVSDRTIVKACEIVQECWQCAVAQGAVIRGSCAQIALQLAGGAESAIDEVPIRADRVAGKIEAEEVGAIDA